MSSFKSGRSRIATGCLIALSMLVLGSTGCQVEMGGQMLPSPYYMMDDIQYYRPGPEFKLSNEAAYMQQMKAQERAQQGPAQQP